MTKRKVAITILSILALIISVTFITSCEMQAVQDLDDASVSRRAAPAGRPNTNNGPQEFTATIIVYQEPGYETFHVGGDRFRTTDEVLIGMVLYSNWGALEDKKVVMNNFTNFHFFIDGILTDGDGTSITDEEENFIPTGNVSGTNHSKVEIIDGDDSVVMTINANGKLEGYIPFGAQLEMTWNTTGPGSNARGDLAGDFYWLYWLFDKELLDGLIGEYGDFGPPGKPFGLLTLTGFYTK